MLQSGITDRTGFFSRERVPELFWRAADDFFENPTEIQGIDVADESGDAIKGKGCVFHELQGVLDPDIGQVGDRGHSGLFFEDTVKVAIAVAKAVCEVGYGQRVIIVSMHPCNRFVDAGRGIVIGFRCQANKLTQDETREGIEFGTYFSAWMLCGEPETLEGEFEFGKLADQDFRGVQSPEATAMESQPDGIHRFLTIFIMIHIRRDEKSGGIFQGKTFLGLERSPTPKDIGHLPEIVRGGYFIISQAKITMDVKRGQFLRTGI